MEESLFVAVILFKKTLLGPNGQPNPTRQTIRIIKATDRKNAAEKLQKFWKEKMVSFSAISSEITDLIE
jgi:hypothetical protein